MSEESLGSGLYLDPQLDFGLTPTGDLRTVSGVEELEKDLSFQLLIILDDLIGQPLTPKTRSEIKSLTVDTILSDNRVDTVDRGSMRVLKGDESLRISTSVITADGEQELVFNL